ARRRARVPGGGDLGGHRARGGEGQRRRCRPVRHPAVVLQRPAGGPAAVRQDADAYGTGIYQDLPETTQTPPGRKLRVVNLGLDPEEAAAMARAGAVEIERVKPTTKRKPVARYVAPEWAEWLQSHRVELNALDTLRFLAWLDAKLAP